MNSTEDGKVIRGRQNIRNAIMNAHRIGESKPIFVVVYGQHSHIKVKVKWMSLINQFHHSKGVSDDDFVLEEYDDHFLLHDVIPEL